MSKLGFGDATSAPALDRVAKGNGTFEMVKAMTLRSWRPSPVTSAVLLFVGLSLTVLGLAVFESLEVLLPDEDKLDLAAEITAGLFAAQLAVVTFILVFSVDTSADWPDLYTVLKRSFLIVWLPLAFLAFSLFAFVDKESVAQALIIICVSLVILGFVPVITLLRLSSTSRREKLLSTELKLRLQRMNGCPSSLLLPFRDGFRKSLTDKGLTNLESLVDQLSCGYTEELNLAEPPGRAAAQLHLWGIERLTSAFLFSEIKSPPTADLLVQLVDSLCRLTVESTKGHLATGDPADPDVEMEAASILGTTSRFLSWTMRVAVRQSITAENNSGNRFSRDVHRFRALFEAASRGRGLIGKRVDPDPPDIYLPADEGERKYGLTAADPALVWWLASQDQNGGGTGVYQLTEILTGEKFFGSFGWNYQSVLGEVEYRLSSAPLDGEVEIESRNPGEIRRRSRETVEAFGGLGEIAGEALAVALSTWEPQELKDRISFRSGGWSFDPDPRRLSRRVRVLTLGPPEFLSCAEPVEAALERLARFTGPPRPFGEPGRRSISDFAFSQLRVRLSKDPGDPALGSSLLFPPLTPLHLRPGAAALAVLIQSCDFTGRARVDTDFAKEFLDRIPEPLLQSCYDLAVHILPGPRSGEPDLSRKEKRRMVIERLEVLGEDIQGEETEVGL
jgi:hypothetical protein